MTRSSTFDSSSTNTLVNNHPNTILTYDEIDDLIYLARTGDLHALRSAIDTHATTNTTSPYHILLSAIDVDEEGLGSQSSLLHYPAANGNLEIIQYLLSLLQLSSLPTSSEDGGGGGGGGGGDGDDANSSRRGDSLSLLNHQNVSGNTALHWAGMNGHIKVVKALVAAGADLEIVNAAGRDAVFEADCSAIPGAAECAVEMLKVYEALEKKKTDGNADDDNDDDDDNNDNDNNNLNFEKGKTDIGKTQDEGNGVNGDVMNNNNNDGDAAAAAAVAEEGKNNPG